MSAGRTRAHNAKQKAEPFNGSLLNWDQLWVRNADSAGHNLLEFSLVSEISLFVRLKPFLVDFFHFFQRGRGEKKMKAFSCPVQDVSKSGN